MFINGLIKRIPALRPPLNSMSTNSKPTLKALTSYSYSKVLKEHYANIPKVPLYIEGKMVESETDEWIPVHNPATQEVVSLVPQPTKAELECAVKSSQEAFKKWRKVSILTRQKVMFELQRLIREHMDTIAGIITIELGKTKADARGDVLRGLRKQTWEFIIYNCIVEVVEHACSITSLQMGEIVEGVSKDMDTYSLRQPLGICAGISPFNFPAMIPLWVKAQFV